MRRVLRWVAVGAVMAVTVGCGASTDAPADDATSSAGESVATADGTDGTDEGDDAATEAGAPEDGAGGAGLPEGCGQRWVEPEEPIPGPVFAGCLVAATSIAQTAHYVNTDDQGQTVTGPIRLADPFEAHFTYSAGPGLQMVLRADAAWITSPEVGWIKADPGGAPEQQMAHGITASAQALASRMVHEAFLASSPHWTPVDGDVESVDDAWAYSGTPDLGEATVSRYVVWVDADHLPVRIEHTTSLLGVTVSVVEEFTDWGRPVEIPVPEEAAEG